jgi:sulfoxide reductase heme-binding subunit YedZ
MARSGQLRVLLDVGASGRTAPLPWLKPAVLTGSVAPIAVILLRAWRDDLGADPITQALNQLGLVALIFLLAALGCTPLKAIIGWTWPMRLRRMLGLLAFFYASLHVITYTVLAQGLDWHAIAHDLVKRKFIFIGVLTFVLLLPLAATSTNSAVKRLGYPRWKQLHRLAYVAPALGVIHFIWSVKRDVREPVTYGLVLASLLVVRIAYHLLARSPQLQRSSCMQHASLRREQAPVLFASHAEQKCTRAVVGGEDGGGHPEFGAHVGDDVPIHSRKNRNDASFSASTPNWRAGSNIHQPADRPS